MRLEELCQVVPYMEELPDYDMKESTEWNGIKAIWYEGINHQGKKTKVFAHIGYPKNINGENVPAVVLVHGGGGHAYPEWIRLWNERGFAAIAMDTTGFFPNEKWKGLAGTEYPPKSEETHVRKLYGDLEQEGYTVGPNNSHMEDVGLPHEEQWMYHAVADTILAHNILLQDPRIANDQIGICGVSWGGVITSIAIGYDNRYAFAIPIYGSAYVDHLPAPDCAGIMNFRNPAVKKLWSASERLHNVNFPVLWRCWTYDECFSIGMNSLSYRATREKNAYLSISLNMGHSHKRGWGSQECYRFAEKVLAKELPFITPISEPKNFGDISFTITVPEDFTNVEAAIYYLTEPMQYNEEKHLVKEWESVKAEVSDGCVIGTVPENAYCYYVEMKGCVAGESYITNCSLVERSDI